jgi:hypothetical protein
MATIMDNEKNPPILWSLFHYGITSFANGSIFVPLYPNWTLYLYSSPRV